MRGLIVLLLILGAPDVMAGPFAQRHDTGRSAGQSFMNPGQKNLLGREGHVPRVGNQQAAAQVRHAYSTYKILSLRLMDNGKGTPIYRVKTLSPAGVVKYVYVDAMSGDVFE